MSRVPEMNDEELSRLLSTLPASGAGEGFTGRVLSRVDERLKERAHRLSARRRLIAGTLAAMVVVAVGVAGWLGYGWLVEPSDPGQSASRVEDLRIEYRELEDELGKLRELTNRLSPMLELGGNDELGFVFDMRELDPGLATETRPASVRDATEPF